MKYIIGDVHGCYDTLIALIKKLPEKAELIFVGDLIDRGPNSAAVIEFVKNNNYDCVLGNHEELMINDVPIIIKRENTPYYRYTDWEHVGGKETLKSYNKNYELLEEHKNWLETLPLFIEYDETDEKGRKLLVSHTAIITYFEDYKKLKKENNHLDAELIKKYEESIKWSRTIPKKENKKYFNVFGHTPIHYMRRDILTEEDFKELSYENIILSDKYSYANVDTGCVFKKELTALEFPTMKVIKQEYIEKENTE